MQYHIHLNYSTYPVFMYYTSDLPVMSKTPLPNTAMYPDLKPQMLHSMRSWADANEEKVLIHYLYKYDLTLE